MRIKTVVGEYIVTTRLFDHAFLGNVWQSQASGPNGYFKVYSSLTKKEATLTHLAMAYQYDFQNRLRQWDIFSP